SMSNTGTLSINRSIYGMAHDDINNVLYVGETDYLTWGKIIMYDLNGTTIDSFDVSVAPGNIAFDIRIAASISENTFANDFSLYPNPAPDEFRIQCSGLGRIGSITIYDVLGQKVFSQQPAAGSQEPININISNLNSGVYSVTVTDEKKSFSRKFIKL
ncbi:MAG: T9SS type A sorting domain-containing protein, partial [Bacteroidia bacterium]|nr:T9SS type A sorting domain-containing protein [Bacteroidia bacterium]